MEKKNVIIICVDGGRLDRALKSDTFAQLSSKCIFFPQTITYAPYTNSAIHALISGSYGNRNGTNSYWHSIKFKKNKFKTLTEYLHDVDYFTHADTPSDLVLPNSGFDKFEVYDESVVDLTERHKELLENMKQINDQGKNFFLYLHYESIHTGILNPVLKAYDNYSKEYFENRKINEERYDKLFRNAENYLESILNEIENLEMNDDSLVLVMSDHGISVGEKFGERAYGAFCYDYTIKTFTYFLANNLPTLEIKQQTRTVDFMPTVLDFLEIPLDHNFASLDGISLIPLINGEPFDEKIAFTETANPLESKKPPKEPNTKSVRTSKWKLIYNEHNNTKELYNLEQDPNENENLIGNGLEIENILWEKLTQLITTRD
jgi:arylsulfatase A-like enzyme